MNYIESMNKEKETKTNKETAVKELTVKGETFNVDVNKRFNVRAKVYRDYLVDGDGVLWAMQMSACLQSSYTEKELAENARLLVEAPIKDGDVVRIEGKKYTTVVYGDYSNCAIFSPVDEPYSKEYLKKLYTMDMS